MENSDSIPLAYQGEDEYVFVCYAHGDADDVYAEIRGLQSNGINVWFDEGISPASEWPEALARAISSCATFLYFVSPRSVASENCRREVNFALDQGCHVGHYRRSGNDFKRTEFDHLSDN